MAATIVQAPGGVRAGTVTVQLSDRELSLVFRGLAMLGDRVGLDVADDCRALSRRLGRERLEPQLVAVDEPPC